ncbi:MAG: esterase-like activity of phytase family protein [Bacteriovoracaceae bacterium]
MKTFMLILLLVSFVSLAQAQIFGPGKPSFPPQQPTGPSQKAIKDCLAFFKELDGQYGKQTNVNNMCESMNGNNYFQENKRDIIKCAETAAMIPQIKWNFIADCTESQFRSLVKDRDYQGCLDRASKHSLTQGNIRYNCEDGNFKNIVKDNRFFGCLNFIQSNVPEVSAEMAISQCDRDLLEQVERGEFKNCLSKLSGLIPQFFSRVSYCATREHQSAKYIDELLFCSSEVSKFVLQNGDFFCLQLERNLDKINQENIQCVQYAAKSLHGNYLDNADKNVSSTHFQKMLRDCEENIEVAPPGPINKDLNFIGASIIHYGERFKETTIGGLSGLAFDQKKNLIYAVSDDPGRLDPNRIYTFSVNYVDGFKLEFKDMIPFVAEGTSKFYGQSPMNEIDAEGIDFDDVGNIIISSETLLEGSKSYIKVFSPTGKQIEQIILGDKYFPAQGEVQYRQKVHRYNPNPPSGYGHPYKPAPTPTPIATVTPVKEEDEYYTYSKFEQVKGIYPNEGFESFGSVPSNRKIMFTANEYSLVQDSNTKGVVRITRIDKVGKKFQPKAEFLYQMNNEVKNGVVDIQPIDEFNLLILERSYDDNKREVTARVFKVNLKGAKDYQKVESLNVALKDGPLSIAPKQLVLELNDLKKFLPAGFKKIDNIEGISFGPPVTKGGKKVLLLVSDNNLQPGQLTQVIALEMN